MTMRITMTQWRANRALLNKVIKRISEQPENYDQSKLFGTKCCIAGHIDIIVSGERAHARHESYDVVRVACRALGVNEPWLFKGSFKPEVHGSGLLDSTDPELRVQAGIMAIETWLAETKPETRTACGLACVREFLAGRVYEALTVLRKIRSKFSLTPGTGQ